ncbi:MAG: hypothetical protein OEM38_12285 [Gammaproteobacteria bacterium]|nr:hypothetical protein [Gammaproteobacteria bacterium]
MPVNFHLFFLIVLGLIFSINISAEEKIEQPDLALLEFLGSFETPDGKWVDPMEIEEMLDQTDKNNFNQSEQSEAKDNE